ncbi:NAD(+) synthetase [Candidatus Roizmanbacteria bacterium CG_4_10_14_0_8_um_filter_39_9]|uniref:NH(3)-dependent NAD(+) synthetase n=1 Tax=Candidatus Roizmanbacteria bacterium CG_4_10_14_0_8_um_filter_39_9 TaxID=1974829 RepID=A0A2M7QE56_9BACT|nr:MAG: NAD(+) synthetase [Candidatus Roizmanbacteria bacterium CG_4_10_14_0_8_um_filter_39_9]
MQTLNRGRESQQIQEFIKSALVKTSLKDIVVGWSGGVDSTVCLYLLAHAIPVENIHVLHLPYNNSIINELTDLRVNGLRILKENVHEIPIRKMVDEIGKATGAVNDKVRMGNIMARVRMIILFDFSKKIGGLVCGTENRTEHLLGYFTRYGDGASDIEPIQHLYKTEVFKLAKQLGVPFSIINKSPSANLWDGQTDEGEFGFSYAQADEVLHRIFDLKQKPEEIKNIHVKTIQAIIKRVEQNKFKHLVPYLI